MKIQHLGNFREALAEVDQEIAKQQQLREAQLRVINLMDDEIIRLGENRDALLTLIASFEESVDQTAVAPLVQVEPEAPEESAPEVSVDQPVKKQKTVKHKPSGIGISFFKAAFQDEALPQSIEEVLEKTGSGWPEKQILWGTVKKDGRSKILHRPYRVDLVDPDSRLRTMLSRDWSILMRSDENPNPIGVDRVINIIHQHPSTPDERSQALARWGLTLNT